MGRCTGWTITGRPCQNRVQAGQISCGRCKGTGPTALPPGFGELAAQAAAIIRPDDMLARNAWAALADGHFPDPRADPVPAKQQAVAAVAARIRAMAAGDSLLQRWAAENESIVGAVDADHRGTDGDVWEAVAIRYIDAWAYSASDSSDESIALQIVAGDIFEVPEAADTLRSYAASHPANVGSGTAADAAQRHLDRHRPVIEAFVTATYQETQARLAGVGIDEVTLHRGFGFSHGSPVGYGTHPIGLNPLSSWSTDEQVAAGFAEGRVFDDDDLEACVVTATVPASRIWALASGTGPGCLSEQEVIVVGGTAEGLFHRFQDRAEFYDPEYEDLYA